MSTQSTLWKSRRSELARQAEKAANAILRSAPVNVVHSIQYTVDVERNQIELFVSVRPVIATAFKDRTQLPVNQSAADQLEARIEREQCVRRLLNIGHLNPHRFDIRLVNLWTGKTDGTVYHSPKNQPVATKSAGQRPALRRRHR